MEVNRTNLLRNMQICRFCLAADENLTNIYDHKLNVKNNSVPLPLQIMACVAIEVFQNDGMPQLICEDCRKLVLQGYRFKANCKKADDSLKLFLATGNFIRPFTVETKNYLPKGPLKPSKIVDNKHSVPMKQIKVEPEQQHDFETDSARNRMQDQDQEHAVEEYEITPSSNNEYSFKLITPGNKDGHDETKTVKTDCFSCTECERSFPLKQLLDIHMNNHLRERNHECDQCNRTFYNKYDLAKHKQIHTDEEGFFSCVICKKEFNRRSNLHRHEKIHENVPKYLCCYCNFTFLNKDDLLAHTKRKHDKKRPFSCDQCGKSFVFKQGLERHISVHNEEKPHKCNYCEASFTSPIKLTRHVTSHAGLRPYPCKLCKRTFLLSHHLTRHMRSHYAAISNNVQHIGQHKCDICSMSFRRKDSLINHSAIHSMVNLKCVICYTEFNNAQAVKEHITTHLSGLPFPCEKCDYSFNSKEQLEEHEVKHAEMEYEEQIEKEVVEEARAKGHITEDTGNDNDEYEEYGGDHMGKNGEDDEDYIMDDDECSQMTDISNPELQHSTPLRRSERIPKAKKFTDFLKTETEAEEDENDTQGDPRDEEEKHQTADVVQESPEEHKDEVIKPIFRTEGTKVYKRKTPSQKPKIITTIPTDKVKTAPLSQINQPQVTTIENLGLTTKDLQALPTEKFVNMKIGNKTVRVQKLVLTKEEMKAMAKQGKIRGNTVLIKNPGQLSSIDPLTTSVTQNPLRPLVQESMLTEMSSRNQTKTYNKKKTDETEACNAAVVGRDVVIINDVIVDNIDDSREESEAIIDLH